MRILHIVVSLDPIYGGQPEVVKQLIFALSGLGHHSEIITLDSYKYSFPEELDIKIFPLTPSYRKYHLNFHLIPWLKKNANNYDAVICHGIWQFQSFGTWIASKLSKFSYFVFVHGALDPWFKQTYPVKHLKKWLYWPWAEYNVLKSATAVIFTSEIEKQQASKSFWLYKANEIVVNTGIQTPKVDYARARKALHVSYPDLIGKDTFLFLGRIHPIKGCDNLIKVFSEFAPNNPNLHLVIAGPDVIGWTASLKKLARELKIENRITWGGMLEGDMKWGALSTASCLVLPSHTENFGIVVAEALACGTPVIISNKVNIWKDIKDEDAGIVGNDTQEGLRQSFKEWLELSGVERARIKQNTKKCFVEHFEINKNAQELVKTIHRELIRKKK